MASHKGAIALPQGHHLLAWLGSYAAFLLWLHNDMDLMDHLIFMFVYLCCLPIISSATTPRIVACLGGPFLGLILGMQVIDMTFDMTIVYNQAVLDESMDPKRLAFFYYQTVINAPHVNAVLLSIILIALLGPMVALERSTPEHRRQWVQLGVLSGIGSGAYLAVAVPRYLLIRVATAYDPALFNGWERVVVARLVLYSCSLASLPSLFRLQGMHAQGVKVD